MGKFTGAGTSESGMKAALGNGGQGFLRHRAQGLHRYNRLEVRARIYTIPLTRDGSARFSIASLRHAGGPTHGTFPSPFGDESWRFPRRPPRHTLLPSAVSLRRGTSL